MSALEEAAIFSLRVQARLPLGDVCIALKDVIPHLSRSSLHCYLQRHGISRLPKVDREKPKGFKSYEFGYLHIDIAELRYEGGKAFLFVAVNRTTKIVVARIYHKATKLVAAGFLKDLVKTVPYKINTALTTTASNSRSMREELNVGLSITSSAQYAPQTISSIVRPSLIIDSPMRRLNAWSERLRMQL